MYLVQEGVREGVPSTGGCTWWRSMYLLEVGLPGGGGLAGGEGSTWWRRV